MVTNAYMTLFAHSNDFSNFLELIFLFEAGGIKKEEVKICVRYDLKLPVSS